MLRKKSICIFSILLFNLSTHADSSQVPTIDLRTLTPEEGLIRILGSGETGFYGLPVAGGVDLNGDGFNDYAYSDITTSAFSQTSGGRLNFLDGAGRVNVIFGDGSLATEKPIGSSDIVSFQIGGAKAYETTGSEIWMSDVTGDGLGDLIIARQNFTLRQNSRVGAGAVTIIPGSPALYEFAKEVADLDFFDAAGLFNLASVPEGINAFTIIGEEPFDRLGIWVRTGDITGDGIDDIAIGADRAQASGKGHHSGKVYVIRGGSHLQTTERVDLADEENTVLDGNILSVLPPNKSRDFHLGGTLNIADLDGNGQAELIAAATLNRIGASLGPTQESHDNTSADGSGGSDFGRIFIVWDELFQGEWPTRGVVDLGQNSEAITDIQGAKTELFTNHFFGEEVLGGLDYNQDGTADLFIGDISGDTAEYNGSGLGFVFFSAEKLKGLKTNIAELPDDLQMSVILGNENGTISADTAMHGDFDNDGIADLAISSPHASPKGRTGAGTLHVLWGQEEWPAIIDLQPNSRTPETGFKMTNIIGANGTASITTENGSFTDTGDTLAYSGAAGDIDGDGFIDIITNEMVGNAPETEESRARYDNGNLIIISGKTLAEYK